MSIMAAGRWAVLTIHLIAGLGGSVGLMSNRNVRFGSAQRLYARHMDNRLTKQFCVVTRGSKVGVKR